MEYRYVACTLVGEHNADIYLSTSAEQREPDMHLIYMTTPGVRQRQQFGWDATEGGGRREKRRRRNQVTTFLLRRKFFVERWSCLSLVRWEASPRSPLNILMNIFVTVGFFACSQLRGPEHSQFAPSINLFISSARLCIPQEKNGSQICLRLCLAKLRLWTPMQMYTCHSSLITLTYLSFLTVEFKIYIYVCI